MQDMNSEQFALLLDCLPDIVLLFDDQNLLAGLNSAAQILFNLPREELIGVDASRISLEIAELLQNNPPLAGTSVEWRNMTRFPGRTFSVTLSPVIKDIGGNYLRMVVMHDINKELTIQQQIFRLQTMLDAIIDTTRHGVLIIDWDGKPLYHNPRLLAMWNQPPSVFEHIGLEWANAISVYLKYPQRFLQMVRNVVLQTTIETYDYLELMDGRIIECHSRQLSLGELEAYRVWNFYDITEAHRKEDELRRLSTHDVLTGLYNRTYFEMRLNQLRTENQYPVSMIMIDVDGLKKVNDLNGHTAGDVVLQKTAEILRNACRAKDVVARLGGDEFGILLSHSGSDISAQVMERIQHLITLHQIKNPDRPLSLSFGSATARDAAQLSDLFKRADNTMYRLRQRRRSKTAGSPENKESRPEN